MGCAGVLYDCVFCLYGFKRMRVPFVIHGVLLYVVFYVCLCMVCNVFVCLVCDLVCGGVWCVCVCLYAVYALYCLCGCAWLVTQCVNVYGVLVWFIVVCVSACLCVLFAINCAIGARFVWFVAGACFCMFVYVFVVVER